MKSTTIDNPFAVPEKKPVFLRSFKSLALIVFCLVAVLGTQYGTQYWLLHRLTADWEQQPAAVRMERLDALVAMGDLGLPFLVTALNDEHRRVARRAHDLLLEQQRTWVELEATVADAKHAQMVLHLEKIATGLPSDREGWLFTLLNASIAETVEHRSPAAETAYRAATDLLAQLQLSESHAAPADRSSARVALRTDSLPVEWADEAAETDREMATGAAGEAEEGTSTEPLPETSPGEDASANATDPSRTRGLRPQPEGQPAALNPLAAEQESSRSAAGNDSIRVERVVVPAQHLTAAPFETYSTRSVITWLQSVQPKLRDVARSELIRRGFGETELALAVRLADPDIRIRLALLNELAHRADVDPRPWLLWMAEDAERDVRLRAVTALATMRDEGIREKLQARLRHEADPAVVALLRRVLSQRSP